MTEQQDQEQEQEREWLCPRAVDVLKEVHPPRKGKASPFWTPKPPPIFREVRVPNANWHRADLTGYDDVVTIDVNGSWFAPISGLSLAFNKLVRTGPIPYTKVPGFYLVETKHQWSDPRLVSPLGSGNPREYTWLTHPTVEHLLELADAGEWPQVHIVDSWTSEDGVKCRASAWASWLRDQRAAALAQRAAGGDPQLYDDVKTSLAVSCRLMVSGRKSPIHRPDWGKALEAVAYANTWRKAWNCVKAGVGPVGMQVVDELQFRELDLVNLLDMTEDCPIKWDPSGMQLGAFKIKAREEVPA